MKRLSILYIALAVTLVTGCKNPGYNDLAGNVVITGKAMFYDTLVGNYTANPMGGLTVYISNLNDSNNYLYTTKTDVLGNYVFTGCDSTQNYIIHARVDSNQEWYSGELYFRSGTKPFVPANSMLTLSPDPNLQNGIFFEVVDANNGRIANALLYVFASSVLATANDTAGATYKLKTDSYGRCLKLNVPYGAYTALGYYVDTKVTLTGSTAAPFNVGQTNISDNNMVLK